MNLPESTAWSEQISISKQYGRQGIATDLENVMFHHLKKQCSTRLIGGTLQTNVKVGMLARKTGFIEKEKVTFIRILRWKKYFSQNFGSQQAEPVFDG